MPRPAFAGAIGRLADMRKWIVITLVVIVALPLLAVGAAAVWLMTADLQPLAERKLSESLERPVKVGALTIDWGDPLTVDIQDVSIANPSWADQPQMLTLAHVFARIDVGPLLHGTLRYQELDVEKLVLVLERDQKGIGNWKFGAAATDGKSHPSLMPGPAVVPKDRTQMPTLLNFTMSDSQIRYRTSSGHWLTIDLAKTTVHTTGNDQPITVTAEGAYNKIPENLQLGGESFEKLRDAGRPFGMNFALTNALNAINFQGTSMDPLDFDGIKGTLTIDSKKLSALLKVFDADVPADLPLSIAGPFAHSDDHWALDDAKGDLGGNPFTGALALDEGPRGGTDRLAITLNFDRLLLDSVVDRIGGGGGPADSGKTKLDMPGKQSPEFKLQLAAGKFQFRKVALSNVSIAGSVGPGHMNIDRLRFPFAGAVLNAKGSAKDQGKVTAVALSADLIGANITDFLKTFDIQTSEIAGKVDASFDLAGTGTTLDNLLADGDGEAVLAMREGKVSKDVLEKASTDLRTVFRKGEGMSRVDCLLAVAKIRNGVATISPLSLHSPDATLVGGGAIDLRKRSIDLVIKSDPKSTGFFALDIPIHVTGPLAHPSAAPASKSKLPAPPPVSLLPQAKQLAQQSGCAA
jgi:AsmA family protein